MHNYNKKIIKFWLNDNLNNITPKKIRYPEGWDVCERLNKLYGREKVVEVGCGYGRLAPAFDPENYIGFDINTRCIESAVQLNPDYTFKSYKLGTDLPKSSLVLFYTVLLHVDDNDILPFLKITTLNTNKVLIAEILGKHWRGWEYAFNREESDYQELLNQCGFEQSSKLEFDYQYYENTKISFLLFEKNKP
jgi:SAM-dependent methyltransferase